MGQKKMPEIQTSNYDRMKDSMADVFLQYNQQEIISRFSLEHDDKYLCIVFTDRNYRINRETGTVTWSEDFFQTEESAGYNEVMTIYDVLCYSKKDCHTADEWVNISSLSSIQKGTLQGGSNIFKNVDQYFRGKPEVFSSACETLHGTKLEKGDAAYEIRMFSFLPVLLIFWEADEDFPASMQIMVDKNTLDFMHFETLMFAISHLFHRIKEICQEGF